LGQVYVDAHHMALPRDWPDTYRERLAAAHAAMHALEAGAVANADEARMVGHYWLRNAGMAPTPEIRGQITGTLARVLHLLTDPA